MRMYVFPKWFLPPDIPSVRLCVFKDVFPIRVTHTAYYIPFFFSHSISARN